MTLATLGVGYVAIGAVGGIVTLVAGRLRSAGDLVMMLGLWPLWLPLSLAARPVDHREQALLGALARAQASPLAQILPDAESARVLASRLREASERLAELDAVLARPDFDPAVAEKRAGELGARGATAAAATAMLRVRTLGELSRLRERYRRELDEVHELIAQLVAQAELLRLQPSATHASGELVRELVTRVEGLGDLFAYQAQLDGSDEAPHPS